jgi:hypothetical protein
MYLQILKFSYTVLPRVVLRNLFKLVELFHIKKIYRSQSNESKILESLISTNNINNKPVWFFEFGISPTEFNCALLSKFGNLGQVVDSNPFNIMAAKKILHKNTEVLEKLLSPIDLKLTLSKKNFSIISIDVDGNDYEFAEVALHSSKPDILICEYNQSFADFKVKVPYSKNFNRYDFHGAYHGASILALLDLAHKYGYCLYDVSENATNAFFAPSELSTKSRCALVLEKAFRLNSSTGRALINNKSAHQLFLEINGYPLQYLDDNNFICLAKE